MENTFEVGGTGREHDLVSLERSSFTSQSHINKELLFEKALKQLLQALHVAVPSQTQDTVVFCRSSPFIPVVAGGLMGHGGCLILVTGPMKLAKDPGCMWREEISLCLFLFQQSTDRSHVSTKTGPIIRKKVKEAKEMFEFRCLTFCNSLNVDVESYSICEDPLQLHSTMDRKGNRYYCTGSRPQNYLLLNTDAACCCSKIQNWKEKSWFKIIVEGRSCRRHGVWKDSGLKKSFNSLLI